jgi:hypothetical protein
VRGLQGVGHEEGFREAAAAVLCEALRPVAGAAASALFEVCEALSAAAYEGSEARGTLLLLARGHPAVEVLLELREPVPLRATRAARKALELSRGEVAPLSDGLVIWGAGRVAHPYDPARQDLFEVRFEGSARWALRHGGEPLLVVAGRPPPRPAPALGRAGFEALARDVLGGGASPDLPRLWAAVSSVLATARGSTVIVSAEAPAEARRLAAQGTAIAPRALDPEALQAATGIGGAILLDPGGRCHAIGVILDGIAGPHGAPSRGSRFNSAANYVRGQPGTLAVVVSDDGSVDLLAGLTRGVGTG